MPRLLIFDNSEDEALVGKWLPVTGGCHVLLTSRHSVWQRGLGVTVVPLEPLDPRESNLLLQRLASHVNASEALQIGQEVGHLPLALQLAGSFLGHYRQITPGAYVTQLHDTGLLQHPSMQGRGAGQSPTGHELNLTRMFTVSWNQLDADERIDSVARHLLACAASLAPGEPVPVAWLQATTVGEADDLTSVLLAEDGLSRLLSLGLLRRSGDVVILHRLLALFTQEFCSAEEMRKAQTRVAVLLARRLAEYRQTEGHLSTLPISASHLRYVSDIALAEALPIAAALATLLGIHLTSIGSYLDAEQILLRACDAARDDGDAGAQARALVALSGTQESSGHYESSLHSAQEAVTLFKELDGPDAAGLAEALYQQGRVLHRLEQDTAALSAAEEGYDLSRSSGLDLASARFLDLMGVVNYYNLGDYDMARRQLEESLAICRRLGNRLGESSVLNHMGEAARLQGDFALAAQHYEEALAIAREMDNQSLANLFLSNLCGARVGMQHFKQAAVDLEELVTGIRDDWFGLSEAYRFLGEAYLGQGKKARARDAAQRALALANRSNLVETSRAWRTLGHVAAELGESMRPDANEDRPYDAAVCFRRSLELLETGNVARDRAITIWRWAQFEIQRGNRQQGQSMAQEAREIFLQSNLPRMITWLDNQINTTRE